MKRNIILALLFFLVLGGALLAKENTIIKVKVQTANVRSGPEAKAPVVAQVVARTLLEVAGKDGAWYKVTVNDKSGKEVTGYIHNSVVEEIGQDEAEAEVKAEAEAKAEAKAKVEAKAKAKAKAKMEAEAEEEAEEEEKSRANVRREVHRASAVNPMRFGVNFGIMTDDGFSFDPIMWTAGIELDFQIGNYLMISPEVTLLGFEFEFKEFILYPALMLNFTPGSFFVGGGIIKGFYIGSGASGSTDFGLKLNAGMISNSIKLTAYAIMAFDSLFKDMSVGATLGFRF